MEIAKKQYNKLRTLCLLTHRRRRKNMCYHKIGSLDYREHVVSFY